MKRFAAMPQMQNIYSYVGNSPVVLTDPNGEFVPFIVGILVSVGVAFLSSPVEIANSPNIGDEPNQYTVAPSILQTAAQDGQEYLSEKGLDVVATALYAASEAIYLFNQVRTGKFAIHSLKGSKKGFDYILRKHTKFGKDSYNKSFFYDDVELDKLIDTTNLKKIEILENGNKKYTYQADKGIGIDRNTGNETNTYTLFSDSDGNLTGGHPGESTTTRSKIIETINRDD